MAVNPNAARCGGAEVTVVRIAPRLLEREPGPCCAGFMVIEVLRIADGANPKESRDVDVCKHAPLSQDCTEIACDLPVKALRTRPDMKKAEAAASIAGRGIRAGLRSEAQHQRAVSPSGYADHGGRRIWVSCTARTGADCFSWPSRARCRLPGS
jgi:hypothetical protein